MSRRGATRERRYLAKEILARVPRPWNAAGGRVVVLCYHSVHPSHAFSSATPAEFDHQIAWLKDRCEIISLREAVERTQRATVMSPPAVAITFDDGYEDNCVYALPILLRHGVRASFFVTTGFIDNEPRGMDTMRRMRRMDVTGMTWSQVSELRAAGMDVGSHTVTHPNLAALDEDSVRTELGDSKRVLEDLLREEIGSIAYPYGIPGRHTTQRTLRMAGEAGYVVGASIWYRAVARNDSALSLPRFAIKNNSMRLLRGKVIGNLDVIGRLQTRRAVAPHEPADRGSTADGGP